MPVNANDFVFVGSASHAEDDGSAQGGQIDRSALVVMFGLEMTGSDQLQMEANVAITATYRITGRDGGGTLITDEFVFSNETGPKNGAGAETFARIIKVEKIDGSSPTGVPSNAVVGFHEKTSGLNKGYLYGSGRSPSGEEIVTVRRLFIGVTRPPVSSPPVSSDYYEKIFILNNSPTNGLSSGEVRKTADPGAMCAFALADAKNDTEQTANRVTPPVNVSTFDSQDKTIPDGNSPSTGILAPQEAIGVWIRLRIFSFHLVGTGSFNLQIRGEGM